MCAPGQKVSPSTSVLLTVKDGWFGGEAGLDGAQRVGLDGDAASGRVLAVAVADVEPVCGVESGAECVVVDLVAERYAAPDTLPQPASTLPAEFQDERATERIGGSLKEEYYNRLKYLAESNGLSMSKATIRLLGLPE